MDRKLIDPRIVSDIADAVREKGGTTEPIVVNQLPQAILDLPIGGNENVSEVVEMVSGVVSDNDLVLANTIAKSVTDSPSEVTFSKRVSGAIKDGVAFVKSFKGNTLKVVQTLKPYEVTSRETSGLTITNNGGNVTIQGTATARVDISFSSYNVDLINGHKYILTPFNVYAGFFVNGILQNYLGIFTCTRSDEQRRFIECRVESGVTIDITINRPNLFDLTAMGMDDVTTADEFAQRLGYASIADVPYIPYTEGSVLAMTANEMVVRNPRLPLEYEEVEYIKCKGGEVIITPLPLNGCDVYIKMSTTPHSTTQLCVGYNESQGRWFGFSNSTGWTIGGGISTPTTDGFYHIKWQDNKQYLYDGDNVVGSRDVIAGGSAMFQIGSIERDTYPCFATIYEVIVYREGVTYHLIPCYRKADNATGLYDIVNNTFYGRAGQEFTCGESTSPQSSFPLPWADIKDGEGSPLFPNGLQGIGAVKDEVNETQAVKRCGIVDLGDVNWERNTNSNGISYYQGILGNRIASGTNRNKYACEKFSWQGAWRYASATTYDSSISTRSDNNVAIVADQDYGDAATFRAAMRGVKLVYELAEPEGYDIEPWKEYYHAEVNGTEEIDPSSSPVTLNVGYQK